MRKQFVRLFFLLGICLGILSSGYCHKRDTLSLKQLCFIANQGQWEAPFLYKAKLNGAVLFAETDRLTIAIPNQEQLSRFVEAKMDAQLSSDGLVDISAYQMIFKGCLSTSTISGHDQLSAHHNYMLGNHNQRWVSRVPLYHELSYTNLYEGISLHLFQRGNKLKYEFIISEEANPQQIAIEYAGANSLALNNGNLLIKTDMGQTLEMAPFAYQLNDKGDTVVVSCKFILNKNTVTEQQIHLFVRHGRGHHARQNVSRL